MTTIPERETYYMGKYEVPKSYIEGQKEFEKKRMIMENEVNKEAIKVMKIDSVLATIKEHEDKMEKEVN